MDMSIGHSAAALAAVVAVAVSVSGAIAQTMPEQVQVKRPDGTIIVPAVPEGREPAATSEESATRADERERMRQEAQQAAEERVERSRREREAAVTNPARQSAPTVGR
jgi:hypothetical protein